jgi:hypothetical protein
MEVVYENVVHLKKEAYPMVEEQKQSRLETIVEVTVVEEEGTTEVIQTTK